VISHGTRSGDNEVFAQVVFRGLSKIDATPKAVEINNEFPI
jgi:hypothetical protein